MDQRLISYSMMAAIVVSEPLCYLMTVFGCYDRSFIHGIMSRFYHEDELYAAKVELAKIVAQLPSAPDGWSKLVSMKGTPTLRRGADGAHRRSQEAEDVLEMTAIADVSKIDLPKFVAADLDRLPGFTVGWWILCWQYRRVPMKLSNVCKSWNRNFRNYVQRRQRTGLVIPELLYLVLLYLYTETNRHFHHYRIVQLTKEFIFLIISQLLCQRVGQTRLQR